MSSKTLIFGASGNVGSEIAKILTEKGHDVVLATSHQPTKENQVQINLSTGEGIDKAFEGIDRAFLMGPAGFTNLDETLKPVFETIKKHNLKKVVLMTAMGANADPNAPMRKAELELENSGVNYNIIRPNWFMQNFNTYWLQGIKQFQKILLPTGDAKGSFIDTRDIASVAAELLYNDSFNNKDFDLTGSQALNHDEVAEIISKVTGKNITYEDISPEVMGENLISAGLSKDYANFMLVILNYFKLGYSSNITNSVKEITGKDPITFEKYAEEHKSFW